MYLDNAASTRISNEVENKLKSSLSIFGNPSSEHDEGWKAKQLIYEATDIISKSLNCKPEEVYYTSGATMGNNIIIQGFLRKYPNAKILYSAIEHNDIILMAEYFKKSFIKVSVDREGKVNIYELNKLLGENKYSPILVTIQAANSEVGTIQDIKQIAKLVHEYNGYFHSDCTQYLPYYDCDVKNLGIDALSMSGQKINCIKGTGMMYISEKLEIDPIIFGEQGLIGGTENVQGIACLGEAFKHLRYDNNLELIKKRDYFIEKLNKPLVGSTYRLPNNISLIFKNIKAELFIELLNQFGICCSAGSACSSGSNKPSHVLKAMGYSDNDAQSCIRFTICNDTTYEEMDEAVKIINGLLELENDN